MGRGIMKVRLGSVMWRRTGEQGQMRTGDVGSGRAMSGADKRLKGEVERKRSWIYR